jgi:hypothetical protein
MRPPFRRCVVVLCACLTFVTAWSDPAAAKSYSADRFDATVRVLPDGTLDVTETVVFRFEDGTFKEVFREIPARRTDGIEVVRAGMEGETLPFGTESGTVEVRQRDGRVRVVWRFRPVEQVTRTFVLNYRVKGAMRRENGADLLVWRGTPGEHGYAIAESTIRFELPVGPTTPAGVTTRKTQSFEISRTGNTVEVTATGIGENGWIDTSLQMPEGSVLAGAPAWQQRAARIDAQAGGWTAASATVVVAGLLLLVAWRQGYDRPPDSDTPRLTSPHAPDDLSAMLGGVVAANGRTALEHSMAGLFALGDRGEIEISEKSRGILTHRDFHLTRRHGHMPIAPYEQRVLDVAFGGTHAAGDTVSLSKARTRLASRSREVSAEVKRALAEAGLLDAARLAIRKRYQIAGGVLIGVALVSLIPAIAVVDDFGPWPFLFPAALLVVGVLALLFGATVTPLSNEGVRRGHRWRAYRAYLANVARGREPATGIAVPQVLPIAVALGLAGAWAKFIKKQHLAAPAWFQALPPGGDNGAFVAFVAYGGSTGNGGGSAGGGGGGGAAGGGSSGAG